MINQEQIKDLLIINEELEKTKKKLKNLSDKKKLLEEKVIENIEDNNLTDKQIETKKYNIDYNKKKNYQSISKILLKTKIEQFFNDNNLDDMTDELIKFIYNSREYTEKPCLKIQSKLDS